MWNVERLSFYRHAPLSLLIAYCDLPLSYDEILGRKIETANRPKGGHEGERDEGNGGGSNNNSGGLTLTREEEEAEE